MRGVICAGGLATRLYPITYATNKHLLPIYNKPMIFYPIETLTKAGITEILVVVSGPHSGHFIKVLKNGKELGVKHLEYAYQENPQGGIADAVALAEDFANGENVAVILGDNTTDANITEAVVNFDHGAHIFLKEVPDPERFGVVEYHPGTTIIKQILEKPANPPSYHAVTGLYLYDNTVFDKIRTLKPSNRGELEITDVNNIYLQDHHIEASLLDGYWRDAGTFQTLFESAKYWQQKEVANVSS